MTVMVRRELLAETGREVKGLVAKDASSAFSWVRLDASGALSVTGSDGGVQMEWRVEGKVDQAGTVTVPGAAFCGALPDGRVLIEGPNRGRVKMSANGVVFSLAAGDGADFHVMRGPKAESRTRLDIPADVLCDMLRKVRFAVSSDGTHKALEGVNVELKGGLLGMTATDGRRLAHVERECPGVDFAAAVNATLPTKAVGILHGLLAGMACRDNGSVDVVFDGTAARFVGDRFCLTAKVIDCVYPNWRSVVPEKTAHCATLRRATFLEALGRASLAAGEGGVSIALEHGRATVAARNEITSSNVVLADCQVEDGAKCVFRVNPRLLKEALEAIDDTTFTLWFDGEDGTPLTLRCGIPWVSVVMPYRKEG